MAPTSTRSHEFSLQELPRVVFRHKGKVFLFFCGTFVLTLLVVLAIPHEYIAESKLFVRVGRETVTLDPTITTGQTLNVVATRTDEINSVVALMRSHVMIEQVVDALGPAEILAAHKESWLTKPVRMLGVMKGKVQQLLGPASSEAQPGFGPRIEAIRAVASGIEVAAERDTSVIDVRCRWPNPRQAQIIADKLVEVYREEHMQLHSTTGSEAFFRDQTALLKQQFNATTEQLVDLKNQGGFASIAGQQTLLEAKKAAVEQGQLETQRQIASSEEKCRALQEAVEKLDVTILQTQVQGRPNAAADGMRQELYRLQIRERQLLETYEPNHPLVRVVQAQVRELREVLEDESGSRSEATMVANPNRQHVQLQLLQERAELAGLLQAKRSLQQQHDEIRLALQELNATSLSVAQLQREAELLDETYRNYSRNFELARIDSALHSKFTNVNVVQLATLPDRPAGPRKSLLAGLGLLAAIFCGLAVALLADWWDQSLNSPDELERALEIPVLMTIPDSQRNTVRT